MLRFKFMCLVTVCGVLLFGTGNYIATALTEENEFEYDSSYVWQQTKYDKFLRTEQFGGYVEEYTNKEFCHSWIIIPGISLYNDSLLGVAYLLILLYIFLGVAIVADIFMEAIETITSKMITITVTDAQGKNLTVEKPFWNPTIANLTLMALGSSAPEILLSVIETVSNIDNTPSELGPQSIVGSAAFNLLVISGVSIMAVEEVKKIDDVGVFFITSIASTFAYIWFFVVLMDETIKIWEAVLTLCFFVILVVLAYGADRFRAKGLNIEEEKEKMTRDVAKTSIRTLAQIHGNFKVLEAARGNETGLKPDVVEIIQSNFKIVLQSDDLSQFEIDELIDVLNPENPIERIQYRREVAKSTSNKS